MIKNQNYPILAYELFFVHFSLFLGVKKNFFNKIFIKTTNLFVTSLY
jgi:hypothetical protein